MTAEVEALLARLDKTASRLASLGLLDQSAAVEDAAALIRAQAEEIAKLRSASEHCGKTILSLEAENIRLREQIAAAARQEPVARVDDLERGGRVRALALKLGLDDLLYAAPVPAGDAVSVSARCCGHEWYQGACVHCNLPVHEYKRPK
jgi:acyl-CoA reductase-like NAD-dependent aldehyde dehydrogenase